MVRRFGSPVGTPGVSVLEKPPTNIINVPGMGSVAFIGPMKKGPVGTVMPITSRREYDEVFGDPGNKHWHLYKNGSQQTPDAVEGFWSTSNNNGMLWLVRTELDGKGIAAKKIFKNWKGQEVIEIEAANMGRWGGQYRKLPKAPVFMATTRSFTLIQEGVVSNQFVDAYAEFEDVPGKKYLVVSNTESSETDNSVIFTVDPQYDLLTEGVSGPLEVDGTATYSSYSTLSGTIEYGLKENLTGTIDITGTTLTGTSTLFLTELEVGDNVYFGSEAKTVLAVTSDTSATIDSAYTAGDALGQVLQIDNLTVTGTGTNFTTEVSVGDDIYVTIGGTLEGRQVASIDSATSLVLNSGFSSDVTAGTQFQIENFEILGTDTAFTTDLSVGDFILNPIDPLEAVKVTAVNSDTSLEIESKFANSFTDEILKKQANAVNVTLEQPEDEGLEVQFGLGISNPQTHFSIKVLFNGSEVLNILDASLDPEDPLFVENAVDDANSNVSFRERGKNVLKWIKAKSLWNATYTTAEGNDTRPVNASGKSVALTKTMLFVVADMDYQKSIGNFLFLDPYGNFREKVRIKEAEAPQDIEGTISSIGETVYGVGTNFTEVLVQGDYIYNDSTKEAVSVKRVVSDTELTLSKAYSSNIPALTPAKKAGYFYAGEGYDFSSITAEGNSFLISHPEMLEGGHDGDYAAATSYNWTKYLDTEENILENAFYGRNLGLVRIACPGKTSVEINKAGANYAEKRSYEFRAELPVDINSAASVESYILQELGRSDFISLAFPSYGYVRSPFGVGRRLVTLSGHIMGGESNYSVTYNSYHQMFSGRSAQLIGVTDLPMEVSRSEESIANSAGVQLLKTVDGAIVVWGIRAPSVSQSFSMIHTRRIQSYMNRIFLEMPQLQDLMFRPNNQQLLAQFRLIVVATIKQIWKTGAFDQSTAFEQAVEISNNPSQDSEGTFSSNATTEVLNGVLSANIKWTPTGIVEKIQLNIGTTQM